MLNAPRPFGKLFFPHSEEAFCNQDSVDWHFSIVSFACIYALACEFTARACMHVFAQGGPLASDDVS